MLQILRTIGVKYRILSEYEQEKIMKGVIKQVDSSNEDDWQDILSSLSSLKSMGYDLSTIAPITSEESLWLQIMQAYERKKVENKLMDFDDIVTLCCNALSNNLSLKAKLQLRFQHILVDEFQDVNKLQFEFLQHIYQKNTHKIFAVGDPKQAIYSFRGADNRYINEFQKYFQDTHSINMRVNYRSSDTILHLANHIVTSYKDSSLTPTITGTHYPELLRPNDSQDEATVIVSIIKELLKQGGKPNQFCILYRSSEINRPIIEALVDEDIPINLIGKNDLLYFKSFIQPVISYLRIATNQYQQKDILNILPSLFINPQKCREYLDGQTPATLDTLLNMPQLSNNQKERITNAVKLISALVNMSAAQAISEIRRFGYEDYLFQNLSFLSSKSERLLEKLDELEEVSRGYTSISDFLAFVDKLEAAISPSDDNKTDNAVNLMTIHASKGLEFTIVFLLGAIDGILPHRNCIEENQKMFQHLLDAPEDPVEEERRLAYVAVTRAKERLYISAPKQNKNQSTEVSRFFRDFFMSKNNERR